MSLMKTLGRVAAGVVVAKGIGAAMQHRQRGQAGGVPGTKNRGQGGLLGDLFGNNTGPGANTGGSLNDMLGKVLGGRGAGTGSPYGGPNSAGASGGLGGLLDGLTSRARTSGGSAGGISDILGQLAGGAKTRTAGGGGLGGLLGGLLGGAAAGGAAGSLAQKGSQETNDASFGELFNDAVDKQGEPEVAPTPEQNAVAGLMLRAMIQAAKSDGKIDDDEKQRLLGKLGDDLDDDERQFIRDQMAAPVDAAALARDVPKGLESQVYLMSILAIDVDHDDEVRYLNDLAKALKLDDAAVDQIHSEVGVDKPTL